MLVLSRKKNERILLLNTDGSEIGYAVIVEIRGDKCRVGFELPESIRIAREELVERPLAKFIHVK